jgi:hypothetical protein
MLCVITLAIIKLSIVVLIVMKLSVIRLSVSKPSVIGLIVIDLGHSRLIFTMMIVIFLSVICIESQ